MKNLIFLLLFLLAAPSWGAWNFTITGTPTVCEDARMDQSNPTTNYGANTTYSVGIYGGNNFFLWITFLTLGDTLALPAYSGTVDGAQLGFINNETVRFDAAGDSMGFLAFPCQRNPNESYISWNTYDNGQNWTTAGGLSTASDIINSPGDTTWQIGIPILYDTFWIDLNPTYLSSTYEDWILHVARVVSCDYWMFFGTEHTTYRYPSLRVWGGGEAPPVTGKGIGGVTLGGVRLGGK